MRHPSEKRTGDLSAQEHDIAEKFLLKIVQEEGFSEKEVRTGEGGQNSSYFKPFPRRR